MRKKGCCRDWHSSSSNEEGRIIFFSTMSCIGRQTTSIECLPVEILHEIVQYLAVPPQLPHCVRSTFGPMDYRTRHRSIYVDPFSFWNAPFPTGLLALSRANKRLREICVPFLYSEQVRSFPDEAFDDGRSFQFAPHARYSYKYPLCLMIH